MCAYPAGVQDEFLKVIDLVYYNKNKTVRFKKDWRTKLRYRSQLKGIKDQKEKNETFHSLPIADRRREIALDALEMLHLEHISAAHGTYWTENLIDTAKSCETSIELQKNLLDKNTYNSNCRVCVRGAMMLSTIRLGNKIDPLNRSLSSGCSNSQKHFTARMYHDMEDVYEGTYFFYTSEDIDILPYRLRSNENLANVFLQVVQTGAFKYDDRVDYLKKILKAED